MCISSMSRKRLMRIVGSKLASILLLGCLLCRGAVAQEKAFVRVETNLPEAVIFADSLRLGSLAGEVVAIPSETKTLRLLPPNTKGWSIAPVARQLDLCPGDTLDVTHDFSYHSRIVPCPIPAIVHY